MIDHYFTAFDISSDELTMIASQHTPQGLHHPLSHDHHCALILQSDPVLLKLFECFRMFWDRDTRSKRALCELLQCQTVNMYAILDVLTNDSTLISVNVLIMMTDRFIHNIASTEMIERVTQFMALFETHSFGLRCLRPAVERKKLQRFIFTIISELHRHAPHDQSTIDAIVKCFRVLFIMHDAEFDDSDSRVSLLQLCHSADLHQVVAPVFAQIFGDRSLFWPFFQWENIKLSERFAIN